MHLCGNTHTDTTTKFKKFKVEAESKSLLLARAHKEKNLVGKLKQTGGLEVF
jgi:hypothetical protein